jgi:hypothetical protein
MSQPVEVVRQPFPTGMLLPGPPPMLSAEQAVLPCGCMVPVGIRMDTDELAVTAVACCKAHEAGLERLRGFLEASLQNSQPIPVMDVVVDLLGQMKPF